MTQLRHAWDRFWAWIPVFGVGYLIVSTLLQAEGFTPSRLFAVLVIAATSCVFLQPLSSRILPWAMSHFTGSENTDALSAEIFIDAHWQDVWAVFAPRPRDESFIMGVSRIEATAPSESGAERIALVMDRDIVGFDKHYVAEVETITPDRFVRLHYIVPYPETMGMKTKFAEYEIHPTDSGTWVRYHESVEHRGMVTRLIMHIASPAKDVLKSLKSQLEGTEDLSIAGRVASAKDKNESIDEAVFEGTSVKGALNILPWAALGITLFLPVFLWALMTVIISP